MSEHKEALSQVEVVERKDTAGLWSVEEISNEGDCLVAVFYGPDSKQRAQEYAKLKYPLQQAA